MVGKCVTHTVQFLFIVDLTITNSSYFPFDASKPIIYSVFIQRK